MGLVWVTVGRGVHFGTGNQHVLGAGVLETSEQWCQMSQILLLTFGANSSHYTTGLQYLYCLHRLDMAAWIVIMSFISGRRDCGHLICCHDSVTLAILSCSNLLLFSLSLFVSIAQVSTDHQLDFYDIVIPRRCDNASLLFIAVASAPQNTREFSTGLTDCFGDVGTCKSI